MPPEFDPSAHSPPDAPGVAGLSALLVPLDQRIGGALPPESRRVAKALARLAPAARNAIRDQPAGESAEPHAPAFARMLGALADG